MPGRAVRVVCSPPPGANRTRWEIPCAAARALIGDRAEALGAVALAARGPSAHLLTR